MTDLSINEDKPITIEYMKYLGFEYYNSLGAMIKEGYGKITCYNENWYYNEEGKLPILLTTNKDLNYIYCNKNIGYE